MMTAFFPKTLPFPCAAAAKDPAFRVRFHRLFLLCGSASALSSAPCPCPRQLPLLERPSFSSSSGLAFEHCHFSSYEVTTTHSPPMSDPPMSDPPMSGIGWKPCHCPIGRGHCWRPFDPSRRISTIATSARPGHWSRPISSRLISAAIPTKTAAPPGLSLAQPELFPGLIYRMHQPKVGATRGRAPQPRHTMRSPAALQRTQSARSVFISFISYISCTCRRHPVCISTCSSFAGTQWPGRRM